MSATSATSHQHGHDQHPPRDTRQIDPRDSDALSARSRTYTRLVYFCLVAGALFCVGFLAGQNSHNGARPSPHPYPVAASTLATLGGPAAGALGFTGPGDGRPCDTPTSRDGDDRGSVMRAGRSRCPSPAST